MNVLFDAVKAVPIDQVVERFGGGPMKGGKIRCPMPDHEDTNPSCKLYPKDNSWHCFSCNERGSNVDLVMRLAGIAEPNDAALALAEAFTIEVPRTEGKELSDEAKKEFAKMKRAMEINAKAAAFFHGQLVADANKQHPARAYLRDRNWVPTKDLQALCERWQLGLATYNAERLLRQHLLSPGVLDGMDGETAQRFFDSNLRASGLFFPPNARGHRGFIFGDRLLFPLHNIKGEVIGLAGRIYQDAPADAKYKPPKYYNSSESACYEKKRELFGLHHVIAALAPGEKPSRVVVCEGYTDVIAADAAGYRDHVAVCGVAANAQHITTLRNRGTADIVFAFDGDDAGQAAAKKIVKDVLLPEYSTSPTFHFAFLPTGQDVADVLSDPAQGREAYDQILADAVPFERFLFDTQEAKFEADRNSIVFGGAVLESLRPFATKIKNPVMQAEFKKAIEGKYGQASADALGEQGDLQAVIDKLKAPERYHYDALTDAERSILGTLAEDPLRLLACMTAEERQLLYDAPHAPLSESAWVAFRVLKKYTEEHDDWGQYDVVLKSKLVANRPRSFIDVLIGRARELGSATERCRALSPWCREMVQLKLQPQPQRRDRLPGVRARRANGAAAEQRTDAAAERHADPADPPADAGGAAGVALREQAEPAPAAPRRRAARPAAAAPLRPGMSAAP